MSDPGYKTAERPLASVVCVPHASVHRSSQLSARHDERDPTSRLVVRSKSRS